MAKVILSTGDLKQDYEVIGIVSASDSHKDNVFNSTAFDKLYEKVEKNLMKKCLSLGGDAVINCKCKCSVEPVYHTFTWRRKKILTLFFYGTAVKLK